MISTAARSVSERCSLGDLGRADRREAGLGSLARVDDSRSTDRFGPDAGRPSERSLVASLGGCGLSGVFCADDPTLCSACGMRDPSHQCGPSFRADPTRRLSCCGQRKTLRVDARHGPARPCRALVTWRPGRPRAAIVPLFQWRSRNAFCRCVLGSTGCGPVLRPRGGSTAIDHLPAPRRPGRRC